MYQAPPFTITQRMLDLVFRIGERISRIDGYEALDPSPRLRKQNLIRSVHSSCAIEANSLSLEQVSDVINGRRVIGPKKDIDEVKNAYEAYAVQAGGGLMIINALSPRCWSAGQPQG